MMNQPKAALLAIEQGIIKRSQPQRSQYLTNIKYQQQQPSLQRLSCGNLAHGFAVCNPDQKSKLLANQTKNLGIVSAYNQVLSAHAPYQDYPKKIQDIIAQGPMQDYARAQFAAGVPAMCDGVTQGQVGMEFSLFSRDVIAQSTAIALSHQIFDGVFCLGICDKIVPGLLIGALQFGHLPTVFLPSGPMHTGLGNEDKVKVRKAFAAGNATREDLLAAEVKSYHSPGTCTFYGTANTNQLLMEAMGLHLPGASFEAPFSKLRDHLTQHAVNLMKTLIENKLCLGELICERSLINAMVALVASGGSTNHTLHLVAIAKAAGIHINWQDFHDISQITPLLARVYPNGSADINDFHRAGSVPFLLAQLNELGLLLSTPTLLGKDLSTHFRQPKLIKNQLRFEPVAKTSGDEKVLAHANQAFAPQGGILLLKGNLGRAIAKCSAVDQGLWKITAPAAVFHHINELKAALDTQQIKTDTIIVLKYQGPSACGMPELHGFMPQLINLLDQGLRLAFVTDGRMSGASGKVPAVIHLTPEALHNETFAKIRSGDQISMDFFKGTLELVAPLEGELAKRLISHPDLSEFDQHHGRSLFKSFRNSVSSAETGASVF